MSGMQGQSCVRTPLFAAPEMFFGSINSSNELKAADVFSLGLVVYCMTSRFQLGNGKLIDKNMVGRRYA